MINFLISSIIIFFLLVGWILIQQTARKFASRHPELGVAKEEGLGCGKSCGCKKGTCNQEDG